MSLMNVVKIAILEDEISEQNNTVYYLNRFFEEQKMELSYFVENDPHEFLKHDLSDYDLALLDIIMPFDINGFDVSKKIRETNSKIAIMFLTKTVNFAINGYEVKAIDYLLKPIIYEDFALKLSVFMKSLQSHGSKIHAFKCKESTVKITEKDIMYIDIYKHYLNIHTVNEVYISRGNIKDIIKQLSSIFSRCSNYCIINFMHLNEIKKDEAILKNGENLRITSNYKKEFLNDFSRYLLDNE